MKGVGEGEGEGKRSKGNRVLGGGAVRGIRVARVVGVVRVTDKLGRKENEVLLGQMCLPLTVLTPSY